ncbi:hypothetical protein OC835_003165 [Tilletia horrida]|nr:hypothetical protein OC835_003165 [Tilletia horrida]
MASRTHTPTASGTASPVRPARGDSFGTPGTGAGAGAGVGRASKRALRDYYGIQSAGLESSGDSTQSRTGALDAAEGGTNKDPHDPDSPAFNVTSAYDSLISTMSLAELLRKSAELVSEIRELDGEKQSLVYNHHHELVAASETIRKMKTRADGLDPSLDSLQSSFSTMSQLAETLALPPHLTAPVLARHGSVPSTASAAASTANPQ